MSVFYSYDGIRYQLKSGFLSVKGFDNKNDLRTHLVFPDFVKITMGGTTADFYIEEIDTGAFLESMNLKEVVLPSHLQWIGSCAFAGCHKLEKVLSRENENVVHIYRSAFMHCWQLKKVKLNTIAEICQKAFEDCSQLSVFDANIVIASKNSFKNCQALHKLSFSNNAMLFNNSIEESGIEKLLFNGDVKQLPIGLSKWLKRKNVQLICVNVSPTIEELAYSGFNVCVI